MIQYQIVYFCGKIYFCCQNNSISKKKLVQNSALNIIQAFHFHGYINFTNTYLRLLTYNVSTSSQYVGLQQIVTINKIVVVKSVMKTVVIIGCLHFYVLKICALLYYYTSNYEHVYISENAS